MAKGKSSGASSRKQPSKRSKPKNVGLCSASYAAERVLGAVLLHAHGYHNTSGYAVFFEKSPLAVFPPEFSLWHVKPTGIVLEVITPFSVSISFEAGQTVKSVVVHDARGKHTVEVEQVPDRSPVSKRAAAKEGAREGARRPAALAAPAMAPAPGDCFNAIEAADIIEACIIGSFDPDKKLRDAGVVESNCPVFRQCIREKVDEAGCKIKESDIPCDPDGKLRVVRTAIIEKSEPQ